MRIALRSLIATAALGLALAPAAHAADSATEDLYVARDACGGQGVPQNERLSLDLGGFTSGCGSLAGFLGGSETDYTTGPDDGVPVTLDTSRPILVSISVGSDPGLVLGGIGDETVAFTLSGRRLTSTGGSSPVTLGEESTTTPAETMLQQTDHTYEYELPLTQAKAGTYKSLTLTLSVGGSQQSGYIDYSGGSLVSLPVFDPIEDPTDGE